MLGQFYKFIPVVKILKTRFFIWTLVFAFITSIIAIGYFSSIKDFTIFPNNLDFNYKFYTDSTSGGDSKILHQTITDSLIKLDFVISNKISAPYLGVSIVPKAPLPVNLNTYNRIKIKARGFNTNGISIALFTSNPISSKGDKQDDMLFFHIFEIAPGIKSYIVNLDRFKIPDWWRELNHIDDAASIKPDLNYLHNINISYAFTPNQGKTLSLEIYSISFSKDTRLIDILIIKLELLLIIIVFLILTGIEMFNTNKKVITISYKPIQKEEPEGAKTDFIYYVNQNFHQSNLTLETISVEVGVSQRRITNEIQAKFGCNLKTYINRLRITESKRLLTETELTMGEIAFKVGFNNQSHFNRVFKTEVQLSPSEYRDKYKK